MKCWVCGIKPTCEVDTTPLGSAFSTRVAGRWPSRAVDHEHAERPPTPGELACAGDLALARIRAIAAE